jgi:very-short-patch-repair endonuclease
VADLHPADATVRDGIPITTAARTLLDIASTLDARELERAFDRGLKGRVLTRHAVAVTLQRAPRRAGGRHLAGLVDAELRAWTETRSEREERFLTLLRAGGLPEPELNVRVGRYTVDALWRQLKFVVEIDGYEYHSTRRSFESDHERDLDLEAGGFRVTRFTAEQVKNKPEAVLVRLTQQLVALETRGPRRN